MTGCGPRAWQALRSVSSDRASGQFTFFADQLFLFAFMEYSQCTFLVYRLAYNGDVAAGQFAVFQGASKVPISDPYGPSEQRGKTANWPRPGGLR